jgi:oligopeptide transport system substrate-binding protein
MSGQTFQDSRDNWDFFSPELFSPSSEEDFVRRLTTFSRGLKYVHDVPHAHIAFQGQCDNRLIFKIVLLRILKSGGETPSLQTLSQCLPSHIRWIPCHTAIVGTLRGRYEKEANIFSLEMDNRLFLRPNHSINLIQARESVHQALEKMIGHFKDQSTSTFYKRGKETMQTVKQRHPQTLRLHLPRAAQSLDPRLGVGRTVGVVIKMLYEGLCRLNLQGEPEPAIANNIEISDDQTKFLFTLKETYWSNGSALTAYDFEYAWKKILEPGFFAPYSFMFFCIKNAEAVKRGELPLKDVGIEVLDTHKLAVTLTYPTPFFLELTASWFFSPLCKEIDQKHPGWAYHSGTSYVCNGPFKLDIWKLTDDLQLLKNPLYWDTSHVTLDQVHITIVEDEMKTYDHFTQNQVDWVGDPINKLPLHTIPHLRQQGVLKVDFNHYALFWLQMDMQTLPFQNIKIRKAFAIGTNRQKLLNQLQFNEDLPAFGFSTLKIPLPPTFCDGDRDLALRYFEEGLTQLGKTREELSPLVISHSDIEEHRVISCALAEQWKDLFGIQCVFKSMPWDTYFEEMSQGRVTIGGMLWHPRSSDPLYFCNLFISRDYTVRISSWHDPTYEQVIQAARAATTPSSQYNLIAQAEQILVEAMPAIPLFYHYYRYVQHPHLKDYIISPVNHIEFCKAYFSLKDNTP